MMFPAWRIAVTALATAVVTTAVLLVLVVARGAKGGAASESGRSSGRASPGSRVLADLVAVGAASGLGVLLWRLGGNVPTLNDDPIPGVSPADVLSAPLAYVAADLYVRLRGLPSRKSGEMTEHLAVAPAVAAVVALVVNIVAI
jgi:hypothetical protein